MTKLMFFDKTAGLTGRGVITEKGIDETGHWVELDKTYLHVKGGGQKGDRGLINGIPVIDVQRSQSGSIRHYVSDNTSLLIGEEVEQQVDRQSRLLNTVWHSAGHLLANVAEEVIDGYSVNRSHQYPSEGWISGSYLGSFENFEDAIEAINARLASVVELDSPVLIENGRIREITIEGFKPIPCGGTHVDSTSQLAGLKVKKLSLKTAKGLLKISYHFFN